MPSLIPSLKFLIDENVKKRLAVFLISEGYDVKLSPKSIKDSKLALISKNENRILVTNDWDFRYLTKDQAYSLVLLKIPQHHSSELIYSFEKLLKRYKNFEGKLIVLEINKWEDFLLGHV